MSDEPAWFTSAIEHTPEERFLEVDGTPIHTLSWGDPGNPGLVFVHGGAAHAQWWSFIAPLFAHEWHAVALDLSGHGDSGRRAAYGHDRWANEVISVARSSGFPGPPVVVGHSLGGMVTIQTAEPSYQVPTTSSMLSDLLDWSLLGFDPRAATTMAK